jgi:hypothetical protein
MERFWSKVEKTDTCWLWRAGTQFGTGRFRFAGENLPAPRVAWLLSREEPVLPGEIILRTCGNLLCVRPEHLKKQSANDDRPREDPGQINGNHRATCASLSDMLKMDWQAKERDSEDAEG